MNAEQQKLVKRLAQKKAKRHLDAVAAKLGYRLVSAPLNADMLRHKEFLTTEEFAWLFNTSERSIQRELAKGRIRTVKIGANRRIHRSEVENYSRLIQRGY